MTDIVGTPDSDFLDGGAGDDHITGLGGSDALQGGAGNDILEGGDDDDWLVDDPPFNGHDNDQLFGGAGDDVLTSYGGADLLDGGSGEDFARIFRMQSSTTLSFDLTTAGGGPVNIGDGTILTGIERLFVWAGSGNDVITGGSLADDIKGGAGNDTLSGGAGDDLILGQGGTDILNGGNGNDELWSEGLETHATSSGSVVHGDAGDDTINGGAGPDDLYGDAGDDFISGGGGVNTLHGGDGADTLAVGLSGSAHVYGEAGNDWIGDSPTGNDILEGGDGDDEITTTGGVDTLIGGAGIDRLGLVVYGLPSNQGISFNIANAGAGMVTMWNGTTVTGFESLNLSASQGADTITGGAYADIIFTYGGDDVILGGGGDDSLDSGVGADNVQGGDGNDVITDSDGELQFVDHLYGNTGDDVIGVACTPGDYLDGGDGIDTAAVSFFFLTSGMTLSLGETSFSGVTLLNFERAAFTGTQFNDVLTGGALDDELDGAGGNDVLNGLAGNDRLNGREGDDILNGGAGDDVLMDIDGGTIQMDGASGNDLFIIRWFGGGTIAGGAGTDRLQATGDLSGLAVSGVEELAVEQNGASATAQQFAAFQLIVNAENPAYGVWLSLTTAGNVDFSTSLMGRPASIQGSNGDDGITSSDRDDFLYGNGGRDALSGGAGIDTIYGGAGDDILSGDAGADRLYGGADFDTVSAAGDIAGVTIHLAGGWAQDGWGTYDTLSGLEHIIGSAFNDTLVGNTDDNRIVGGGGDDWIVGLEGDDVLEGGAGVNVLSGGTGIDLASYASSTAPLWVNMAAGVYSAPGVWDVFFESIEGVRGGSGNDSLFGNGLNNRLEGGAGDDALIGLLGDDTLMGGAGSDWIVAGDGNDRLIGGDGVDVLTGGNGADIFDLGASAGWDVAFDFNTAQDRFQLGGLHWLGFLAIDADGDGQVDDTLLGYAGGNFVALNVSGLTLTQWNALVDAASGAEDNGEKLLSHADPETSPTGGRPDFIRGHSFDFHTGTDGAMRDLRPENPFFLLDGPGEWGPLAA